MRIKSIYIKGMKDKNREVFLELSGLNVSVIYGLNGSGKTTLLRILNAVLEQQENVLLNEKVEEVRIIYFNDEGEEKEVSIKGKEQVRQAINVQGESIEIMVFEYDWKVLKESELSKMTSILFGVNRGITNNINITADYLYNYLSRTRYADNFRNRDESYMFCSNLSRHINLSQRRRGVSIKNAYDFSAPALTIDNVDMNVIEELLIRRYNLAQKVSVNRVQKALFDTLADACNSLNIEERKEYVLEEILLNNKDKLVSTLEQMERNTLSDKIISILKNNDIELIVKECQNNVLLTKLIVNMSNELEKEEGLLQSLGTLKSVFDEYIGPNKYIEISENNIEVKFKNSKEKHGIDNLSSGEKHLLVLLTIFIVEGRERKLLMIDEPEISLNIKWQRKLMPLLSKLAPDAQIIVASHSPSIAKTNTQFLVELR